MPTERQPWNTAGYSDIVAAELDDGRLAVRFANGDAEVIPLLRLGLDEVAEAYVDSEDATKVVVVLLDGERDIDWMQLRAATDSDFAKELRRRDAEESKRLGRRLKALREDSGLRQADIADLVGMTAPQLSKIEKGQTDMRISTVRSLLRAMNAGFEDVAGDDVPEVSRRDVVRAAVKVGMPRDVSQRLVEAVPREHVAGLWHRAVGQRFEDLFAGSPIDRPQMALSFKAARNQAPESSPLLHLALTAVSMAAEVGPRPKAQPVSREPEVARQRFVDKAGEITLASLLRGVLDAGIVVLPMVGSGGFSAVACEVDGRPAIVLKESRDELAFWLFVLAHELGHHAHGHVKDGAIVDIERPDTQDRDGQESEANDFALRLLMPDYKTMLAEIRDDAEGPRAHIRFKFAVERVAAKHEVNTALLAMIAAYELTDLAETKDRWGSAMNIAKLEGSATDVARAVVSEYLKLDGLEGYEAAVLRTVLV